MEYYSATERNAHWEFPGGPVVRTPILLPGSWAQSLIRELRSCNLCGKAKKKKKKKKRNEAFTPATTWVKLRNTVLFLNTI